MERIKWEYKFVNESISSFMVESQFDVLGEEGWELCTSSMRYNNSGVLLGYRHIFKRIKIETGETK